MASFTLVRELADLKRENGNKRLLLALYSASDSPSPDEQQNSKRYIALSEQERSGPDEPYKSTRKGITIRRGELETIISALQSADFDAKPDGKNLTHKEYAELYCKDW